MEKSNPATKVFSCSSCLNLVALRDDLLSKSFLAKSGQAFMFAHAMNVTAGYKEERQLLTGHYTVADVYCVNCGQVLGWKYVHASDMRQHFKVGKYILERAKLVRAN